MKNYIFYLLALLTFTSKAQETDFPGLSCAQGKQQLRSRAISGKNLRYPGDASVDVGYYFLNLKINPGQRFLEGEVQINLLTKEDNLSSFFLDLNNSFKVDSVIVNGALVDYLHESNQLKISLSQSVPTGTLLETMVYYRGVPVQGGDNFSIEFTMHNGQPVIWTLSEPYDAPTWFPCVDNQADKADSVDIWVTLPSYFTVASQGLLQEIQQHADGTNTAKWKSRYPIAHYLISIAASNYQKEERYFHYSENDSMLVADYLYPETRANPALAPLLDRTVEMLQLFSDKYGLYPFINEKYGHAMFGFGGGMEHQTISSMGGFSFGLIAHELAHQWFGDHVTCKTWRDIWVNEGFAEFSALYAGEVFIGKDKYERDIASYMQNAKVVEGTVAIEDPSSVDAIFDFRKTYVKGSLILHMLRGVLGDDVFFQVLKEYQTTEFAFGAVSIEDFQLVAERVSGQSLQWFFDEWLFGEGYPQYTFGWAETGEKSLTIQVNNTGTSSKTPYFTMPVELLVNYNDGSSELLKVFVDSDQLMLNVDLAKKGVSSVEFDPNNLILKDLSLLAGIDILGLPASGQLKVFPNPVNELLQVEWPLQKVEFIPVYNATGRQYTLPFDGNSLNVKYLPAGRYFIKLISSEKPVVASFVKF